MNSFFQPEMYSGPDYTARQFLLHYPNVLYIRSIFPSPLNTLSFILYISSTLSRGCIRRRKILAVLRHSPFAYITIIHNNDLGSFVFRKWLLMPSRPDNPGWWIIRQPKSVIEASGS